MSQVPPQDPWDQQPGGQPPSPTAGGYEQPGGYPAGPTSDGWEQPGGWPQPGGSQQPPGYAQQPGGSAQQPGGSAQAGGWQQPPGYGPPPGAWQQGPDGSWQPPGFAQQGALANWGTRVLGLLIDWALFIVVVAVLDILAATTGSSIFSILSSLIALAAAIFFAVQLGQSGSTPGMRMVGIKCVNASTGQPIGPGMGVLRSLAHIVDTFICYIGWLFPLWDRRRQTLADKLVGSVVMTVPRQPLSLTPKS